MFKNLPVRVVAEAPPPWMSEVEMTWAELEEEDEDEDKLVENLASLCLFPKL